MESGELILKAGDVNAQKWFYSCVLSVNLGQRKIEKYGLKVLECKLFFFPFSIFFSDDAWEKRLKGNITVIRLLL